MTLHSTIAKKTNLIQHIRNCMYPERGGFDPGIAWNTLANDLERSNKPLQLSYADLAALEMVAREHIDTAVKRGRSEEEVMQTANTVGLLCGSLKEALASGVVVTSDPTRAR